MSTNARLHSALHDGGSPISGRQSLSAEDYIHKAKVDLQLALLYPGRYKESSRSEGQAEKRKYGGEAIVFAADSFKRRRLEERDLPPSLVGKDDHIYPWLAHQPAESELSPSLRRTRELYAGWRRDVAGSLNVILDCSERPEFYPRGWEKLLRGDYIDLEDVYREFMHDCGPNDRATGKVTTLSNWSNWFRAFSPLSSAHDISYATSSQGIAGVQSTYLFILQKGSRRMPRPGHQVRGHHKEAGFYAWEFTPYRYDRIYRCPPCNRGRDK